MSIPNHVVDEQANEPDTTIRPWWEAILVGAGAIFLGLGVLGLIWLIARPLALVLFGVVIAAALSPIVDWLGRWIPRIVAVLLVYLLLVGLLVAAGWFIIPPLTDEFSQALDQLPDYIQRAEGWLQARGLLDSGMLLDTLASEISAIGSTVLSLPLTVGSAIVDILLVFFISIYWLMQSADLKEFFLSLFPPERRANTSRITARVGRAMGGYLRGVVIDALIIGVLMYVGLVLIGVNYPLVLAVLGGLFEIIPFLGPILSAFPILLVALLQSPTKALITLGFLLVLQQVEGNIVTPNVLHSQTEISPLLVIIALFIGGAIGGLIGALLAIPLAAAARVFIIEVLAPAIRRKTGAAGHPVEASAE